MVETILVRAGFHGGTHPDTACWEYRRKGTGLRMLFGFFENFTPDDLLVKVLDKSESPSNGLGATIQLNADQCLMGPGPQVCHSGRITVGKGSLKRDDLVSQFMNLAPEASARLGLSADQQWPILIGSASECAALLDSVFLYAYGVEQVKRHYRGETLLSPLVSGTGNMDKSITEQLKEIEDRTDIGPTQKKQLILARRGQGQFRRDVCKLWRQKCAVTGCGVIKLLRASHLKPWSKCDTDAERLDPYNGLLLTQTSTQPLMPD